VPWGTFSLSLQHGGGHASFLWGLMATTSFITMLPLNENGEKGRENP